MKLCCLVNPAFKCDVCKRVACIEHGEAAGWKVSNWCESCWNKASDIAQESKHSGPRRIYMTDFVYDQTLLPR